jgi:hypothetical protein
MGFEPKTTRTLDEHVTPAPQGSYTKKTEYIEFEGL